MTIVKPIIQILILGVAICATSCGSNTSIETSWKSTGSHAQLRSVVTVMMSKDASIRRTAEDDMAQRLRADGVHAVPAYSILDEGDYANHEAAKGKLAAQGFDGVIAMRLVSKQQQLQYVPATFNAYWGPAWPGDGYLEAETVVRVETTAYSLRDESLVYSALSKTIDPNDVKSLIAGVTKVVAGAMQKQGVVAAAPAQHRQAPSS